MKGGAGMKDLSFVAEHDPVRGEDLDTASSPAATSLLGRILATSPSEAAHAPRRRGWVRGALPGASVAAVAAVIVLALIASQSGDASAPSVGVSTRLVVFRVDGPNVVAQITDPNAAAAQLTQAFEEYGLDIHVNAVPVSPSLVGSIVYSDAHSIDSIRTGECLSGGTTGCDVGLVIPKDYSGEAYVTVGRSATSDEVYASSADVFGPGESLHCSGMLGATVSEANGVLKNLGLIVRWTGDASPSEDDVVVGGIALSATSVMLDTAKALSDVPSFNDNLAAATADC